MVPAACALMLSASCSSDNDDPAPEPLPDPIKIDLNAGESRAMTASNEFGIDLFKAFSRRRRRECSYVASERIDVPVAGRQWSL